MDLKLVQLLRSAMNAGGPGGSQGLNPTPRIQPRPVHNPQPRIEPRRSITPAPHFEPRPVHRPEPRFETYQSLPIQPSSPSSLTQVLPPPWKTGPTDMPPEPRPVIKKVEFAPDIISKGSLIDFFI